MSEKCQMLTLGAGVSGRPPAEGEKRRPPQRMLRFPGRPSLADFDLLGQKLQEDADPDWQESTLPKIDSVQFVDVARVELLKAR